MRIHLLSVMFAAILAPAAFVGCGSERTQTGTQAPITDEMQRQAEASDKYLTEQSQPKKAATR